MSQCAQKTISSCVIITGMSGGGKSSALKILEDEGFFAIDNLPHMLLPQLMDMLREHSAALTKGVAVVVDVRSEGLLEKLQTTVRQLRGSIQNVQLLFLDASDSVLLNRFGATRRKHPMGNDLPVLEGITEERAKLRSIRTQADVILDSSGFTQNELRAALLRVMEIMPSPLTVLLTSFGYKYGIPIDADYVFDVRFLTNPYYVAELRNLSGCDDGVKKFIEAMPEAQQYIKLQDELIRAILPFYTNTGKKQIHIATGCTGGRHRSVALTEKLARSLESIDQLVVVNHRDIDKGFVL